MIIHWLLVNNLVVLWEGWQDFATFEIVNKLNTFGFVFDRQAAGSHEIQYNWLLMNNLVILNDSRSNS
ncbi:MAG: hypothetical protein F6K06_09830 [Okeania sp. SIO1H4]|uniref:hypothetical protein n=1 Tax=Okeania sp. SIO1H5 TaxID=2607777 RepID=UPI0013C55CFB|nr:hypothetical protein [Okeania sp. SIO1H5]NES76084.1 hypothetical protein [Okeania sp. SIO1H4]